MTVAIAPIDGAMARVRYSTRADGDFHLEQGDATARQLRRRRFVDRPWTQLDEVHGVGVVVVAHPGDRDGAVGDAMYTTAPGAVLGIWTGDCAPVAIIGDGMVGAAHAGWRGLVAGVLEALVGAMRAAGAGPLRAELGPCIHQCCYEFGADDLALVAHRYGPGVIGRTTSGANALDVPAAVRAALDALGVGLDDRSACTGCHPEQWFSHRVRNERGRQMMAVWMEPRQ